MRSTKEIVVKHPWWHYPWETIYHEGYASIENNGLDENKRTIEFSCTYANCKFKKIITYIWVTKQGR